MIQEAEELRNRFIAIQQEVTAYKALSIENSKLQEDIERMRREKDEAKQTLVTEREALAREKAAADARVAEAQQAAQRAQLELATARQGRSEDFAALERDNARLRSALSSSIQGLAASIFPQLPSDAQVKAAVVGKDGSEITTLEALMARHAEELEQARAAAAKAEAEARASRGFGAALLGAIQSAFYFALAALVLYYSAAILAGVPPRLNFEFGVGCVVVSWVLPLLRAMFGGSRRAARA